MRGAKWATGKPVFGNPMQVVAAGGVKVGLLALGYHSTHLTGDPDNVRTLEFGSGIDSTPIGAGDEAERGRDRCRFESGLKVDRKMLHAVKGGWEASVPARH